METDVFGAMQEVALKQGGATIPVTEKNKVGATSVQDKSIYPSLRSISYPDQLKIAVSEEKKVETKPM